MAYSSDESGRFEVYVQPFPSLGGKWQLSNEGGKGPVWSRDGSEIFYTHGDRMMVVSVQIEEGFSPSAPRELFRFDFARTVKPARDWDVSPDGKRFFMSRRPPDEPIPRRIDLITNFAATHLPEATLKHQKEPFGTQRRYVLQHPHCDVPGL